MAIDGNSKYLGRRIGTSPAAGKPIYAVADPCASPGKQAALRIGTNPATGKPVYVEQECDAPEPAMGTKYLAKRIGTNPATGKEVFALRCQGCKPCNQMTGIAFTLFGCYGDEVGVGFPVALDRTAPDPVDGLETLITDGASCVRFDLDRPGFGSGTYRVRVAAHDRFVAFTTQGYIVNCGNPFTCVSSLGVGLSPTEPYACFCSCGPRPWAKTLYLTTKWGTVTLTWTGGPTPAWVGTQVITTRAATTWWWITGPSPETTYNPHCFTDHVQDGQAVTVEWTLGFGAGCLLGCSFVRARTCNRWYPDYPHLPLSCAYDWPGNPGDQVGLFVPIADDAGYLPVFGPCDVGCQQYYMIRGGGYAASSLDCANFVGSGTLTLSTDSSPFTFNE
jgi:hypothetical protein